MHHPNKTGCFCSVFVFHWASKVGKDLSAAPCNGLILVDIELPSSDLLCSSSFYLSHPTTSLLFSSCSHFNYSFLSKTQPRALACTRSCIKETQTPWLKATISSSAGTRMHALIEQRNGKSNARSLICVSVCLYYRLFYLE